MASEREVLFQNLVREFPDSAMGHFSLGRLYLDEKRYAESVVCLQRAVDLEPTYAAALVALGDAAAGAGDLNAAKQHWQRALESPHGRRDASLQADLEQRLASLDDF